VTRLDNKAKSGAEMKVTTKTKLSVFIAQASELYVTALVSIVGRQADKFEIVGTTTIGKQAIEQVEKLKPDIAIITLLFRDMNGLDVVAQIKRDSDGTKLVIVTSDECPEHMVAAFAAGADSYHLHDTTAAQIEQALEAVAVGSVSLGSGVANKIFLLCERPSQISPKAHRKELSFGLSKRELEVLALIVDGKSNREIAIELVVSVETAKTHVRHIMEKMRVSDRTEAAVKCVRDGIFNEMHNNHHARSS
jgi:two-component system, NarL family, response regulator LiaR